ncbi:uncharacterized protein VTP21DRAFT_8078 [Calcarisporiella thermophila]|uniref:uncharacterized protein n=1 Tax=Calcarisporiella thermophila TaxID=911321 RepID=UPI0037447C21
MLKKAGPLFISFAILLLFLLLFKSTGDHSLYTDLARKRLDYTSWSNNEYTNTTTRRAKAAFVILARNTDVHELRWTIRQLEARFNHKYNYPYIFLNDVEFEEEFKTLTQSLTNAKTHYGVIPHEHWSIPHWVDEEKAREAREQMAANNIIYGGSLSYRHMCRFESGFFYRHELLKDLDYYWRVEPSVDFFCDIDYDPFLYMQDNDLKYGFTISLFEYESTIPTLWKTTKEFIEKHPEYVAPDNAMDFVSNDGGNSYNLCHFWSNFEIADLKFWRSEAYSKYFEYLDKAGGFFYERWGDAPVHSIAASIFLNKSQIHFFNDIGYRHNPFQHCPQEKSIQKKCHCNPHDNFDDTAYSCMRRWREVQSTAMI